MILVITSEKTVHDEIEIINQMFHEGLDLLHIRKPMMSREDIENFVQGIEEEFYPQLVLHGNDDQGKGHLISRFHFSEANRLKRGHKTFVGENIISTSVHNIHVFNALGKEWEYAFLSPVFPSISKKGYGEQSTVLEDIQYRNNREVQLIALGGINEHNISRVFADGADGAALLGAIWESDDPADTFRKCRQKAILSQSY